MKPEKAASSFNFNSSLHDRELPVMLPGALTVAGLHAL